MRARVQLLVHSAAAALLAACGGTSRGPTPEPTTTVDRPATPSDRDASAPAVEAPVVRGPSVAARYSSGTQRYAVVTTATVDLSVDGAPLESDTLVTRTYVTYVLGGGGAGQSVGGTVDSVFVTSRRSPTASQAVTVAVPFSGLLTPSGVRFAGDSAAPLDAPATIAIPVLCGPASTDALLAVARELLVAFPPMIAEGVTWRDSTTTLTCRGNVPLATTTVHDYRVSRVETSSSGVGSATVERTSRSTIAGQGSGGSVGTTIVGTGSGQGRLTFDLAAGRYTGGDISSAADLVVNAGGRAQRLTQHGTTRVSLVQAP